MPKTDDRPLYLQIAADLRARIMSGDLVDKIPSIKTLMPHYGTTTIAVIQRALAVLADEGLVETRHGVGTTVRADRLTPITAVPYIEPTDSKYVLLKVTDATFALDRLPDDEHEIVPADVAQELWLNLGESATLRKQSRVRRADGAPIELIWNYYPKSLSDGTAIEGPRKIGGGVKKLLNSMGHFERSQIDQITGREPTKEEVEVLSLPSNASVLRTLRRIEDQDGDPMEVSVIVKGSHLYALKHQRDLP